MLFPIEMHCNGTLLGKKKVQINRAEVTTATFADKCRRAKGNDG